MNSNRLDLVFVDLDNTLWLGTLGDDPAVKLPQAHLAVLEVLDRRGVCFCILTNNPDKYRVVAELKCQGARLDLFVGVLCCPGPKVPYLQDVRERLGVPWCRLGIVDDDALVRNEVLKSGGVAYSSIPELASRDWDTSNPPVDRGHLEKRKAIRRYAIELASLNANDLSGTDLLTYLKRIGFRLGLDLDSTKNSARIAELLYRTSQMHFNKPVSAWGDQAAAMRCVEKHLADGGRLATVRVAAQGMNLGVQGCLLYEDAGDSIVVANATYSCSILPYRVVESLFLASFVNRWLRERSRVVVRIRRTETNGRVTWLLRDMGAEEITASEYAFTRRIFVPHPIAKLVGRMPTQHVEDGVPPITSFYDKHVLKRLAQLPKGTVLDIGSGFGEILGAQRNEALGKTLAAQGGQLLKGDLEPKNTETQALDVRALAGFDDGSMDVVFCLELLEHVDRPERGVTEILRVLKEGGVLFFSVPGPAYPFHAFSEDHNRFSLRFLLALLRPYGRILQKHRQMFNGHEVRSVILFQRGKVTAFSGILESFAKPCNRHMLPNGICYFDVYADRRAAMKWVTRKLSYAYFRGLFAHREHYKLVLGIVGAVLSITGIYLAAYRLQLAALSTQHSTIISMLMSDEYRANGVSLVPGFQTRADHYARHFGDQLASVTTRALWNARLQGTSLAGITLSTGSAGNRLCGTDLSGVDLSRADLDGVEMRWLRVIECNVTELTMRDAVVVGGTWQLWGRNAVFRGLKIRGSERETSGFIAVDYSVWSRSSLEDCDFTGGDFVKASFNDSELTRCSFDGTSFSHCSFSAARLSAVSFSNCTFHACVFDKATLVDCVFDGSEIRSSSSFRGANLGTSSFVGAALNKADFSHATVSSNCTTYRELKNRGAKLQ